MLTEPLIRNEVTPNAVIFGCEGLYLSDKERLFFQKHNPLGFILFARNCFNPEQVSALVQDLKSCVSHADPLILIDQEGGRVARLKPPHWREYPPARMLASQADKDEAAASEMVFLGARLIASDLLPLGINVDCVPLADVPVEGCHDIIGDRTYGTEPMMVAKMAGEAARGLMEGGVLPVLKHIPGHGRASVDSHEDLPIVTATLEALRFSDFVPFKHLNHLPIGMTAHVLYEAIDPQNVATLSPHVIRLIREEIGFEGLLMSDDISMKALKGDIAELSRRSLDAGCDVVLHCNGKMDEMEKIMTSVSELTHAAQKRHAHAVRHLTGGNPFDIAWAEAKLQVIMEKIA